MNPISAMDFLPRNEMQKLQLTRLQTIVKRAYDNVPLFRQRLDERKVKPEDIRTLADIQLLPFTVKQICGIPILSA